MTGNVLFYYNRAGNNGGAIYLNHSVLYASQGSALFHNNIAKNGGAIFIGEGARLYTKTSLEFSGNSAQSYGGAVYVDLHCINDAIVAHQLSGYYYNLLTSANCICDLTNTAYVGNCAYLNSQPPNMHSSIDHYPNLIASSSRAPCRIESNDNSTAKVNYVDLLYELFQISLYDLHLVIKITDCSGNPMGPINA